MTSNSNSHHATITTSSSTTLNQPTQTSSLSSSSTNVTSSHHDPFLSLCSHTIKSMFGIYVQYVVDVLQCRGTLSYKQLLYYLLQDKKRKLQLKNKNVQGMNNQNESNSNSSSSSIINKPQIRAALLVLIQHNFVTMKNQTGSSHNKRNKLMIDHPQQPASSSSQQQVVLYTYQPDRVLYMVVRYSKIIEYMKKVADSTASIVIQILLLHGRLRTIDYIMKVVNTNQIPKSEKHTTRQVVIDSLYKLVTSGFIETVPIPPITNNNMNQNNTTSTTTSSNNNNNTNNDFGETEFEPNRANTIKSDDDHQQEQTVTNNTTTSTGSSVGNSIDEDPAVLIILKSQHHYRSTLPIQQVLWRINFVMFHETFRAYSIGKCIQERYGHQIQSIGTLVTAALRYRSHLKHANKMITITTNTNTNKDNNNQNQQQQQNTSGGGNTSSSSNNNNDLYQIECTDFTVEDILKYIPKPVISLYEKKNTSGYSMGNVLHNLQLSYQMMYELCHSPMIVRRIGESKYEIAINRIISYQKERITYQMIQDRFGDVTARIFSILSPFHTGSSSSSGGNNPNNTTTWLEADTIAEYAMIPAKDTRESLHHLYRARYVDLFPLHSGSYNPLKAIYLWGIQPNRLQERIMNDVMMALYQIRIRYEHQIEMGKQYIERAAAVQQAQAQQNHVDTTTTIDENENEDDKYNYAKFCLGLERLTILTQQLDETLMILRDF